MSEHVKRPGDSSRQAERAWDLMYRASKELKEALARLASLKEQKP